MSSLCAFQHSPSAWANFVPKLTSTLTVTENENLGITHVKFLRHLLTNPSEHGDSTKQDDHGVQILADVFTCSAEPQSPLNAWLERSIVHSLGTWPSKSTDGEMLSFTAKSLSICCTMRMSVIRLTVPSASAAHHNNAIIYPELRAGQQPIRKEIDV